MQFQWACGCLGALAWQDASGALCEPDSGIGKEPSVSSGPDPALTIYFLPPVTGFIEVARKVGFYSLISRSPPPPGIISFPSCALKTWKSLI